MKQDLHGVTVVITGAGSGIGRSIAVELAKEGCNLVLCGGNNIENMEITREMIRTEGGKAELIPGDLTDRTFREVCLDQAAVPFHGFDVLINNAGLAIHGPLETTNEEDLDRILELNVKVPYMLCQKALPYLRKSKLPAIVNMVSVAGHKGYEEQSAYAASKHGILGFTKSLAAEVAREGIRVHAISPGGVKTDMIKVARPDLEDAQMILPEEVAEIIVFLLSHRGYAIVDEINLHRPGRTPFEI